jgi:hypothetical protein
MKKILVFATLALIAAACSSAPNLTSVDTAARGGTPSKPNTDGKYDVTGLLEVTVNGIGGDPNKATATAVFHGVNKAGQLGAKNIYVNAGTVTLTKKFVSSFDLNNGAATQRYVQTGFEILNSGTFTYANMTMVATSLVGATVDTGVVTTVGGTAISSMINSTGGTITDVPVARSFIPSHGFTPGFNFAPNPNLADMQYLTRADALNVKYYGQVSGVIPAINVNKVLPLEYGFTGRNTAGTSRVIYNAACTVPAGTCNKGYVTFAHSFPLNADVSKQPVSYKSWYVVANEYTKTYSHALEGDVVNGAATVAGLPLASVEIKNNRTRILEYRGVGKTFVPATGVDTLENVCQITTANAVGADPVVKYPVVNPTFPGAWDGCFGEGGQRARTFSTAFDPASSVAVDPISDDVVIVGTTAATSKIALAKFDKSGRQTMSVEYTPPSPQFRNGNKVLKAVVSPIRSEIYVLGVTSDIGSEFGQGRYFVLRFSSTGVANAIYTTGLTDLANYSSVSDATGDIHLGPVNPSFPNNQPVYFLYQPRDFNTTTGSTDYSWRITALDGGNAAPGTIPLFGVISTFGTAGTFTNPGIYSVFGVNDKPVALAGNASNMVMVGYNSVTGFMENFSIDYNGNGNSLWGFGGANYFSAGSTTVTYNNTLLFAGAKFFVTSAKLLSNGKLLVAGTARTGAAVTTDANTFIFQSTATGVLDTAGFTPGAFINTATRFYNCSPSVTTDDLVPAITVRPNGEIFVVSYGSTGHCVARLSAIGTVLSTQDYDLAYGYVKSPASSAQFTAAGRLAIGGTAGTSAIVGLIKQ